MTHYNCLHPLFLETFTQEQIIIFIQYILFCIKFEGRRGRDRIVVGFTTTCAIRAYNH
jgi:hypothetical protein